MMIIFAWILSFILAALAGAVCAVVERKYGFVAVLCVYMIGVFIASLPVLISIGVFQ